MAGELGSVGIYKGSGAVASVVDVRIGNASDTHCFIGVNFYSDAALKIPVAATAGTIDLTVRTVNSSTFQALDDGTINAATPELKSFSANPSLVRATPTGILTAAFYEIIVTTNRS